MRKIAKSDEQKIIRILRNWPIETRLTWEALRTAIFTNAAESINEVWTRQALSNNENIRSAYEKAKRPKSISKNENSPEAIQIRRIEKLETELAEMTMRFELLKIRHMQLIYNASLLDGGTHLLDDPLPNNTQSQRS